MKLYYIKIDKHKDGNIVSGSLDVEEAAYVYKITSGQKSHISKKTVDKANLNKYINNVVFSSNMKSAIKVAQNRLEKERHKLEHDSKRDIQILNNILDELTIIK